MHNYIYAVGWISIFFGIFTLCVGGVLEHIGLL